MTDWGNLNAYVYMCLYIYIRSPERILAITKSRRPPTTVLWSVEVVGSAFCNCELGLPKNAHFSAKFGCVFRKARRAFCSGGSDATKFGAKTRISWHQISRQNAFLKPNLAPERFLTPNLAPKLAFFG